MRKSKDCEATCLYADSADSCFTELELRKGMLVWYKKDLIIIISLKINLFLPRYIIEIMQSWH